jgi:hypothetical protein
MRAVEIGVGVALRVKAREQADLAKFANTFMRNIQEQQKLKLP